MGRWMPLLFMDWDSVACLTFPFPVTVGPELGIGFIPVFGTEEEAKAQYPEAEIVQLLSCTPESAVEDSK